MPGSIARFTLGDCGMQNDRSYRGWVVTLTVAGVVTYLVLAVERDVRLTHKHAQKDSSESAFPLGGIWLGSDQLNERSEWELKKNHPRVLYLFFYFVGVWAWPLVRAVQRLMREDGPCLILLFFPLMVGDDNSSREPRFKPLCSYFLLLLLIDGLYLNIYWLEGTRSVSSQVHSWLATIFFFLGYSPACWTLVYTNLRNIYVEWSYSFT